MADRRDRKPRKVSGTEASQDLAIWLGRLGAPRQYRNGWERRTTHRHSYDGTEWAVAVDWATDADGNPVPASVILTSLGGTLGDPRPEGWEPRAVTRAVVESVPWGESIWGSRHALADDEPRRYAKPPMGKHDALLRHVGDLYREVGGSRNPRVARKVREALELEGVKPQRRGPKPGPEAPDLRPEQVRRWIQQARERGYITDDPVHRQRRRRQVTDRQENGHAESRQTERG